LHFADDWTEMNLHIPNGVATPDPIQPEQERLRDYLRRLVASEDLVRVEATDLLGLLMAAGTTDAQIAAVLAALAQKGETGEELAGLCEGMRARMVRLRNAGRVIDTAGTGASKAKTFNVSTAAAFVIAAAGLPIAKHGARAATSRSGSADVLTALGVKIDVPSEVAERCLEQLGICFLFAPQYHPAAARVAPIRREIGIRTAFNLIGPLSNPAGAPLQVLGVSNAGLIDKMAGALALLGCECAWVVCGDDGLDEVSLATATTVAEVKNGEVKKFKVSPEDFGVVRRDCEHLCGGDAEENARKTVEVLAGRADVAATDLVSLNAAAALRVGLDLELIEAYAKAREALESGAALTKLEQLRAATNDSAAAAEAQG
jgi:anthranilate phosphoribosyltransferase